MTVRELIVELLHRPLDSCVMMLDGFEIGNITMSDNVVWLGTCDDHGDGGPFFDSD